MKYEDMLTWTLFYTSILDAGKVSMVDVVDPGGLVRSRAIQNVSGDLRITLNGAENLNTLAGQFIDRTFGAAVQHLAFSCTDIFATAEALAVRGFEALEISPNYYEDLGARFGLQDAFLARLQLSKVLYDEDADGRYFQLYSRRRTSECSSKSSNGTGIMTDMVPLTRLSGSVPKSVSFDFGARPNLSQHCVFLRRR